MRSRLKQRVALVTAMAVVLGIGLMACAQPASPTPAPVTKVPAATGSPATSAPAAAAAATDPMVQIAAEAKKEGSVVMVTNLITEATAKPLAAGLKKKYGLDDSFKVDIQTMTGGPLQARVSQEVQANKVTVDIMHMATPALLYSLKSQNALLQFDPPEAKNYSKSYEAGLTSEPGYWMSPVAYTFSIGWNPKDIKEEFVSWKDPIKDQYKGKIVLGDVSQAATYSDIYIGLRENKVMAADDWRALAKLEPFYVVKSEEVMQKAANNEYPIAYFGQATRVAQQVKQGVPMKHVYPKEGVVWLGTPSTILAKAPHPNAAKLLLNYMLTEEGLQYFVLGDPVVPFRDNFKIPEEVAPYLEPGLKVPSLKMDWKNISGQDEQAAQKEFLSLMGR